MALSPRQPPPGHEPGVYRARGERLTPEEFRQLPSDQEIEAMVEWFTALFREFDLKKHIDFRGGFEPIPDVVIFRPDVAADWRRRNRDATLRHMLMAIEVKASERAKSWLGSGEIMRDIHKLAAHRDEVRHRGSDMHPVMMVSVTVPSPIGTASIIPRTLSFTSAGMR